MARLAFNTLSEKQAEDIVILDIRPVSGMADYFVVASATSGRQLRVLADTLAETMRQEGPGKPSHVEGAVASGWVLVDLDDVVVHLFDAPHRAYYRLEELWQDGRVVARMP